MRKSCENLSRQIKRSRDQDARGLRRLADNGAQRSLHACAGLGVEAQAPSYLGQFGGIAARLVARDRDRAQAG